METWLKDTSGFVRHTKLEGKKCRTKKEIDELVHVLEAFKLNNIPIQSERISKTSLLASQLQNTDARNRAANLINRQDNIIRRLDSLSEHLQLKAQRLNGKQENGVIEVSKDIVVYFCSFFHFMYQNFESPNLWNIYSVHFLLVPPTNPSHLTQPTHPISTNQSIPPYPIITYTILTQLILGHRIFLVTIPFLKRFLGQPHFQVLSETEAC